MEIHPPADKQQILADLKIKIFLEFFTSRIFCALPDSISPEMKHFRKNAPFNHDLCKLKKKKFLYMSSEFYIDSLYNSRAQLEI